MKGCGLKYKVYRAAVSQPTAALLMYSRQHTVWVLHLVASQVEIHPALPCYISIV